MSHTWDQTQPPSGGSGRHHAQGVPIVLISEGRREASPTLPPAASLVNSAFFTPERVIIQKVTITRPLLPKPELCEGCGLLVPATSNSKTAQSAPHLSPCPLPLYDIAWCVPGFRNICCPSVTLWKKPTPEVSPPFSTALKGKAKCLNLSALKFCRINRLLHVDCNGEKIHRMLHKA